MGLYAVGWYVFKGLSDGIDTLMCRPSGPLASAASWARQGPRLLADP